MKIFIACLLFSFSLIVSVEAAEVKKGDVFHITGCENGVLELPIINIWTQPGGIANGARIAGKLSASGRVDKGLKCEGAVVKVLDTVKMGGREYIQIQSVVNSKVGWITDSFVGKKVTQGK